MLFMKLQIMKKIRKMKSEKLFYSKVLLGIGLCAAVFFPHYAYYWKTSTMEV